MNETSANPVLDAAMAYQKTAALMAAVKLDIFSAIGSGTMSSDELALRSGAAPRGLRILCDYLTVIDLMSKTGSRYALKPAARIFLDRSSPFAMGSILDFVAAPETLAMFFDDPPAYVRRGGANGLSSVAPDHPIWVRFARAMVPFAAASAKRVAVYVAGLPEPPGSVLDVGAGHGLYGIEVAKLVPRARITALDWASVLEVARAHAEAAGVADRFRTLAGDATQIAWGDGFDLILLPNLLHHFDAQTCTSLLRKAKAGLAAGGRALAVELVPNQDRVSPSLPAMFAFWMLASTPSGDAYTASELDAMARDAGFGAAVTRPLAPTPHSLVIFEN
jgi:SAM-dependent methyltransferase